MKTTKKLIEAVLHVKDHFPQLAIVIFTLQGKWCYMDEDFNIISFSDQINVSTLEDAMDSVEATFGLPFIYQTNL